MVFQKMRFKNKRSFLRIIWLDFIQTNLTNIKVIISSPRKEYLEVNHFWSLLFFEQCTTIMRYDDFFSFFRLKDKKN